MAYKIITTSYFANFSGTGAGKTLSAIMASRVINSKMTAIVCPNDVVNQGANGIVEAFPNSEVKTGNAPYNDNKRQYLVLKFGQEDSPNLVLNLTKQILLLYNFIECYVCKWRKKHTVLNK